MAFLNTDIVPTNRIHQSCTSFKNTQKRESNEPTPTAMSFVAPPEQVIAALANERAVVIDVRRDDEIQSLGRYEIDRKWFNASGTPEENDILEKNAEEWIPDKDVPIVLYCRSGRRAVKAKEILEAKGYKHVVNGGGLDDMNNLPK